MMMTITGKKWLRAVIIALLFAGGAQLLSAASQEPANGEARAQVLETEESAQQQSPSPDSLQEVKEGMEKTTVIGGEKVQKKDTISPDLLQLYKHQADSILTMHFAAPLESPYDPKSLKSNLDKVDSVKEEYRSEDFFKVFYKTYRDLNLAYGEYTNEVCNVVDRLIEIISISKPGVKKGPQGVGDNLHKNYLVPLKERGEIFLRDTVYNKRGKQIPFTYFKIYKEREDNPSIYFLDDRLDEMYATLTGYIAYLRGNTRGGITGEEALRRLTGIRSALRPARPMQRDEYRNTNVEVPQDFSIKPADIP